MGDYATIEAAKRAAEAQVASANIAADAQRFGASTYADASRFGSASQANASNYTADTSKQMQADRDAAMARENALKRLSDENTANLQSRTQLANTAIAPGSLSTNQARGVFGPDLFAARPRPPLASTPNPNNMRSMGLSSPVQEEQLYSHGTARVPGHGDGTVDTVDAKLAPGEAVLNKAAAEMLGRGLIDLLNKHGMLQMGMPEPDEDDMQGEPQHHAAGCSSVRKYASGTSMVTGKGGSGRVIQPGDLMDNHGRDGAGWEGSSGTGRTGIFDAGGSSGPAPSAGVRYQEPGDGGASGRGFDYANAARTLRNR